MKKIAEAIAGILGCDIEEVRQRRRIEETYHNRKDKEASSHVRRRSNWYSCLEQHDVYAH